MILVTGGAGFIGSHLVNRLVKEGADVIVLDNLHRGSVDAVHPKARLKRIDIGDTRQLQKAMEGAETVFHLAAHSNVIGSGSDPEQCSASNVVGTYNVLFAAENCGVRRVIFTSSREVYGEVETLPVSESTPINPKNTYGSSKAAGEKYCQEFAQLGLEVVTLRLANVYGAGDSGRVIPNFFNSAMRDEPLTIYGRGKVLDFIHVDNVVDALVASKKESVAGRTLNVGSGKGTSLEELARTIISVSGSKSRIEYRESREIEVDRFVADIEASQQALGYSTDGPLDDWRRTAALQNLSIAVHKQVRQRVSIGMQTPQQEMAAVVTKKSLATLP